MFVLEKDLAPLMATHTLLETSSNERNQCSEGGQRPCIDLTQAWQDGEIFYHVDDTLLRVEARLSWQSGSPLAPKWTSFGLCLSLSVRVGGGEVAGHLGDQISLPINKLCKWRVWEKDSRGRGVWHTDNVRCMGDDNEGCGLACQSLSNSLQQMGLGRPVCIPCQLLCTVTWKRTGQLNDPCKQCNDRSLISIASRQRLLSIHSTDYWYI